MKIYLDIHDTLAGFKSYVLAKNNRHEYFRRWGAPGGLQEALRYMQVPTGTRPEGSDVCISSLFDDPAKMWQDVDLSETWQDLPKLPWADGMVMACVRAVGVKNVYLLTSPPEHAPQGITGTYLWVKRHFPALERRVISCPTELKAEVCQGERANNLLIDDWQATCSQWEGPSFCVPSLFNGYEGKDWTDYQVLSEHVLHPMADAILQVSG